MFTVVWEGVIIQATFSPNDIMNHEHLELRVPTKQPLPVTDTGYRSEFLVKGTCDAAGGPQAYVTQWLDRMAQSHVWKKQKVEGQQLQLF